MAANDLVLLDKVFNTTRDHRWSDLPGERAFELFACDLILRDHEMSADEVSNGVVGGGDDGGIDGAYVFLDNELVAEDSAVLDESIPSPSVRRGVPLELLLVQAKRTESFGEKAVNEASISLLRLLDLNETEDELRTSYSTIVVDRISRFRRSLVRIADRYPTVKIRFLYASRGDSSRAHPKVLKKLRALADQLRQVSSDAVAECNLLGAKELWELSRNIPSYTLQLRYDQLATIGESHVALVKIRDVLELITASDGTMHRHIFDSNVRDYEGAVEVNREISESLRANEGPDFGGSTTE